jgi:hypothetical protein
MNEFGVDFHILCISAIHVPPGRLEIGAQVFVSSLALLAMSTGEGDPSHTHSLTLL